MAREHIEYIQSQELIWRSCEWPYPGMAADVKVLSQDDETGACSVLLRLPAGWQSPLRALSVDEELLVLDGAITLGDYDLAQDCYAWLPGGSHRETMASAEGAVILAFYSGMPLAGERSPHGRPRVLDAFAMPWSSEGMDPVYGDAGMRWKILRHDPETEDLSMLVMAPPHLVPPHWSGPQEQHDCFEEAFVLSGDFLSPIGIMRAGAYFWRPPHILHGPYGTRGGNLSFIRTLGGVLENNWTDREVTLDRTPERSVELPPRVARALSGYDPPVPY
ncbi:MAG: DUF4437 domain-containing protein [Pseudohaliea sp.]